MQVMMAGEPHGATKQFCIERLGSNPEVPFVAFWVAAEGDTRPPGARAIHCGTTATELRDFVKRHYPWAECRYVPEDVTAVVEAATRHLAGGDAEVIG